MQQGQRDQTESNLADNDVELFMRGVIDFVNKKNRKRTGFKGRKTQKGNFLEPVLILCVLTLILGVLC